MSLNKQKLTCPCLFLLFLARSLREALEDSNKEWTNLLTEAGFDFSMTNVTVMALTDSALENPDTVKVRPHLHQPHF